MTPDPNSTNEAYQALVPGLTPETIAQFRELGLSPEQVELGYRRQYDVEAQQQQQLNEDVQLALAAQQAVADGETTYAEAAAALLAAGRQDAHDAVVQQWREDEGWYAAQDAADELAYMDAEQYVEHHNAQQLREREQLLQQAKDAAQQLEAAKLTQLIDQFNAFVQSTPGAHQIAPAVEKQLVEQIRQDGIPATQAEQDAMIESALRKEAVVGQATESIKAQVDTEWRIHRKNNGKTDGLMTAANIAAAEAHWKAERTKQLSDAKMIHLDDLKPGPTAEEQTAALTEKYRAKQEHSTAFGQNAADIAKRGAEANATRDRGHGITEEKKAYKEAYARAEAEAQFGPAEVRSGYAPTHEATVEAAAGATKDSGLPEGFVDEYGPGLLGTLVSDA
jgi:hypothetical protein